MFNYKQFKELIVDTSTKLVDLYSEQASQLVLATIAHESLGGTYIEEIKGPGLGIIQMIPATFSRVWDIYLKNNKDLKFKVYNACKLYEDPEFFDLSYNLRLAVLTCRIFYLDVLTGTPSNPVKEELPALGDIDEVWRIYKKYYNTSAGLATEDQFKANFKRFKNG